MRTSVLIIGAGPAGLLLSRFLTLAGIDNIILERRSRQYIEERIRAGLLEDPTVELLTTAGVGDRLVREGQFDEGFELRFDGQRHWIPMTQLTGGKRTVLYPQQEVVKDLLAARDATGDPIMFNVGDAVLSNLLEENPTAEFHDEDGEPWTITADFIIGCDGFHGVSRKSIPPESLRTYQHDYPFGWLGILADVPPSTRELIYAHHPNGFAMHSRRSDTLSRLYLQVPADADANAHSDQELWEELQRRLGVDDGWVLREGPVLQKSVTPMRSFVVDPLQYGRLFLAGDAAHIVPPTAAKGLNLAAGDVSILSEALMSYYKENRTDLLDGYSERALRRIWRAQEFSRSMTALLHHLPDQHFDAQLQHARLVNLVSSEAAMTSHCELYAGLPFEGNPGRLL